MALIRDPDPHWDFCLDPDPKKNKKNNADPKSNVVFFIIKTSSHQIQILGKNSETEKSEKDANLEYFLNKIQILNK